MTTKTTKTTKTTALTINDVMVEAIAQAGDLLEAKDAATAVSDHLITIALTFKGKAGTAPNGRKKFKASDDDKLGTFFLGACYEQELWAKSDKAGINKVDKLPRCWIDAKSVIRKAMSKNIPLEGKSLTKLKELNKEGETTKVVDNGGKEQTETSAQFQTILNALYALHESLPEAQREELQQAVVDTHTKYQAMLQAVVPVTPTAPAQQQAVNH